MQLTNIIVAGKALYTNSPGAAKDLNKAVAEGKGEENFPGGKITDTEKLVQNLIAMMDEGVKFEWRDAPKKKIAGQELAVFNGVLDMTPYQELKALSSGDQANVMFMSMFHNLNTLICSDNSAGHIVHTVQQMASSLGMICGSKTSVNCLKSSEICKRLAKQIDFEAAVVHLHQKTVEYKVITTFQALIVFAEHDGMTSYYLENGNYLLEIGDQTMEIAGLGYVVRYDAGFDDELLKVGYKIVKFTQDEARAVLTLSKVLEVARDGNDFKIAFSTAIPGVVTYPGFQEYSLSVGGVMKASFNSILRSSKGKVTIESGWYGYSVQVLALRKFFIENLEGDMKYVKLVEDFLDKVCIVDPMKLSTALQDLVKFRRQCEKDVPQFLQNPFSCIEFSKRCLNVLSAFGVSGSGVFPYTEKGVSKALKYPKFEENANRLKAGRFSRNSDPRKFLHKQYPIVEGGPAAIMGDATADKWERILQTLKALGGGGVLSKYSDFLYAGVTNNDRMLGGICKAWSESRANGALQNLVLLDKNTPNSSRWNLKYGDHEFTLRSPQNPAGEFVSMDFIKYLDSLDSTGDKRPFLFSDCNILSTDDESYNEKNEFAAEGIELGYEKLTSWIVTHKKATPNAVAAAKYIFKCASKFKAGVIKLHLFKIEPGFLEAVMAKLFEICALDSLIWKEGRGHNPEFYFYFFPRNEAFKLPFYKCSAWILPLINCCSAVSELTRHVSFYCPNKIEGEARISDKGILGHSSAFPVIFPSATVRPYVAFEVGGKKFTAIKNIRVGTKSLVAGIANEVDGTVDLDSLFVGVPPPPKEEETAFIMTTPPVPGGSKVIRPIKYDTVVTPPAPVQEEEKIEEVEIGEEAEEIEAQEQAPADEDASQEVIVEDLSDSEGEKTHERLLTAFD